MLQKTLFYASLILLLGSCKKEEQDYRLKYTGNFDFTVIEESWMLGQDTLYDSTTFYNGSIRKFLIEDENLDLDQNEFHFNTLDPDKRITIIFSEDKIITPEITDEGAFMLIQTYHYFHEGRFSDADNIEFSVTGLGGLGGGLNYYVSGKRK